MLLLDTKSIEPAVFNRQDAAKFLGVSTSQLKELEELPYWPEGTRFYLNVPKALASQREERHYLVEGLRQFIRNAIEESKKVMRAPRL